MMKASMISLLLLAHLASSVLMVRAAAQKIVPAVVVNLNNPVENISLAELRKIFAGQRRAWPGGTPIKIVVRDQGTEERAAVLRLLGMSENEYEQYWRTQVFRGEAYAEPLVMPSFGMVKEAVADYSGAIAIVDFAMLKPDMKVVKINGHLPTQADYPLQ